MIKEFIKKEDMQDNTVYAYQRTKRAWEVKFKINEFILGYAIGPWANVNKLKQKGIDEAKNHCIETAQRSLNLLNMVGSERYQQLMGFIDKHEKLSEDDLRILENVTNNIYPVVYL